ncbi:MAG: thioredoxin family protein [Bacteroidia bacterium]|nr:thioredoxin family protein [Bacteroidia bacterium]
MVKRFLIAFILLAGNIFAQDNPVKWTLESKKISDCEYDLIFKASIDEPWHIYSVVKSGEDGPNPTSFFFKQSRQFKLIGNVKESTPIKEFDKVFEVNVAYHAKKATFTQRIKLLTDAKVRIEMRYEAQACTEEKCVFPPADVHVFEFQGTSSCVTASKDSFGINVSPKACVCDTQAILAGIKAKPKSGKDEFGMNLSPNACECDTAAILGKVNAEKSAPSATVATVAPADTKSGDGECHPWSKFFLGLFAGLGAVLMPCIYSLIPLTVSFFVKRSKNRASGIKNAMLYGFFIIITFVIPTMLITIIFGPDALSNIATNTWLNLFFFLLFVVFALSFFGMFEITLPSSWGNKLDQKADKGGVLGIFFMAATLVVVSFSCTAGFLGTLLTALAEGNSYICPLFGFTGFGTGIALPFMIFAFFPSMLNSLPKSGGWMNTFKVSVAFIELALAVKFLANADNVNEWGFITREVFISLWVAIFGMMTFYLLGVFKTSHDDDNKHLSVGRIIFATIVMSFTIYLIPGLWGAPLKIISSFPPPHHYSESPNGVGGGHGSSSSAAVISSNPEIATLEAKRIVGPDGLLLFKDDYESALQYAKLVKKPLFVDFTGLACVNCRLMESTVWVTPEVFPMLKDSVVIVSLYVDNKVDLPEAEQKEVFWYGKQRKLETIGNKWAYLQSTKYQSSSQPQYVVLNHDESNATPGTMGTETNQKLFATWLRSGLRNFK